MSRRRRRVGRNGGRRSGVRSRRPQRHRVDAAVAFAPKPFLGRRDASRGPGRPMGGVRGTHPGRRCRDASAGTPPSRSGVEAGRLPEQMAAARPWRRVTGPWRGPARRARGPRQAATRSCTGGGAGAALGPRRPRGPPLSAAALGALARVPRRRRRREHTRPRNERCRSAPEPSPRRARDTLGPAPAARLGHEPALLLEGGRPIVEAAWKLPCFRRPPSSPRPLPPLACCPSRCLCWWQGRTRPARRKGGRKPCMHAIS
jgi:hypothetical protein